jgi:hypothetical protein
MGVGENVDFRAPYLASVWHLLGVGGGGRDQITASRRSEISKLRPLSSINLPFSSLLKYDIPPWLSKHHEPAPPDAARLSQVHRTAISDTTTAITSSHGRHAKDKPLRGMVQQEQHTG